MLAVPVLLLSTTMTKCRQVDIFRKVTTNNLWQEPRASIARKCTRLLSDPRQVGARNQGNRTIPAIFTSLTQSTATPPRPPRTGNCLPGKIFWSNSRKQQKYLTWKSGLFPDPSPKLAWTPRNSKVLTAIWADLAEAGERKWNREISRSQNCFPRVKSNCGNLIIGEKETKILETTLTNFLQSVKIKYLWMTPKIWVILYSWRHFNLSNIEI